MFKTIVNFRYDRGRLGIDSKLTRPWPKTEMDNLLLLKEINRDLDLVAQYEGLAEFEGMQQLGNAFKGMTIRRSMDSAVEGPFILDHDDAEVSDKFLKDWFRSYRKGRK
jgi:hypothetical protein